MPASLENAARWKPTNMTPKKPPVMPSGLKAPFTIMPSAGMIWSALPRMTMRQEMT